MLDTCGSVAVLVSLRTTSPLIASATYRSTESRPRDDRNVTGRAVPRTGPVPDDDHHNGYYPYYPGYIYDPYYSFYYDPFYYSRYGYWAPYGYGYGLGYFSYDPFLFGAMGFPATTVDTIRTTPAAAGPGAEAARDRHPRRSIRGRDQSG